MINLITSLIFWCLYLLADAFQDAHHARTYGYFSHRTNFYCRLVVGIGATALVHVEFLNWWVTLAWGVWLIALAWPFFDRMYNLFADLKWNHVGTGGIDNWFRQAFPMDYSETMMLVKVAAFILATINLIILMVTQNIF